MVRRDHRTRRFKPGRYILLLLIIGIVLYSMKAPSGLESGVASLPSVDSTHTTQERNLSTAPLATQTPAKDLVEKTSIGTPVASSAPVSTEGSLRSRFSMLDEIATLEAIDIVAIKRLDLRLQEGDYIFDTQLAFSNNNLFPVHIVNSDLDATLILTENLQLRLGAIRIKDITLSEARGKTSGETDIDVSIVHGTSIDDLQGLLVDDVVQHNGTFLQIPLNVHGTLSVQIPLLGGFSIDRTVELEIGYQPDITVKLLAAFRESVRNAWNRSSAKG